MVLYSCDHGAFPQFQVKLALNSDNEFKKSCAVTIFIVPQWALTLSQTSIFKELLLLILYINIYYNNPAISCPKKLQISNVGRKTASDSVRRKQNSKHILVAVPKDYLLGPVFAAKKQDGARKVQIGDMVYEIGGVHPFDEPGKMTANKPAFDVRHARAIFALLSIRDPADIDGARKIRISFDELCRRYAIDVSGRNAREIPEIVGDLLDTYIRVTNLKTNKS